MNRVPEDEEVVIHPANEMEVICVLSILPKKEGASGPGVQKESTIQQEVIFQERGKTWTMELFLGFCCTDR